MSAGQRPAQRQSLQVVLISSKGSRQPPIPLDISPVVAARPIMRVAPIWRDSGDVQRRRGNTRLIGAPAKSKVHGFGSHTRYEWSAMRMTPSLA